MAWELLRGAAQWDLLRGAARGLSMAGFYGVFGAAWMSATLLRGRDVRLGWLIAASLGLCIGASTIWYLLQTQDFAGAADWADEIAALPTVAFDTRFGMLLLWRCAVLIVAAIVWRKAHGASAVLAFGAVVAQAWLGHGGAMEGRIGALLLVTSIVHLGAGAVWLGALPALGVALARLPPPAAQPLARAFSPIGIACVVLLVVTAAVQYACLIWRPGALITSDYGVTALVKLVLLAALIALALANRTLTRTLPTRLTRLRTNIGLEIAIGICVLVAAGMIMQFEPPTMAAMSDHG